MTAVPQKAPEQLVLELPHLAALAAEDFFISASNKNAVDLIESWPGWPRPAVAVCGPHGSGKTHLGSVWRARSGAHVVEARDIGEADLATFEKCRALVVENIDRGAGDERVLFHVLNSARENGLSVLLTTRAAPGEIGIALPDLRSRLRALPLVMIEPPDEALLKAVLVKLFADRQLAVEPHVVNYIALHMERSMEAANGVVAAADRLALSQQRKVTRAVAAEALAGAAAGSGT